MDEYAVNLRKNLWNIIDKMVEYKELFVKNPGHDYTRRRKLPLEKMLKIFIQLQAKSLPHELGDYCGYSPDMPTASAFIQQRAKLTDYAFPVLFSAWNDSHKPRRMVNGYRLIACDGSDLYFAANPDETNCCFEAENARSYCLAHLNALQDVIGGTYLDAIVQDRRCEIEVDAMITMLERYPWDDKTIYTADRGYESYKLMAHIHERKQFYVLRVKSASSNGILSGLNLPENTEFDKSFTVTLTRKQTNEAKLLKKVNPERYRTVSKDNAFDLCDLHHNLFYNITFRAVCIRLSDGNYEYLVTNLPETEFSPLNLKQIYHLRWGIETAFRQLKYTIGLNGFHTKKAEFIRQEIFARLILFNFCQLIASYAAVFRKSSSESRVYKLNFSMVIGACRALLKSTSGDPPDTIATIARFLVSARLNSHFPRNVRSRKPLDAFYRIA